MQLQTVMTSFFNNAIERTNGYTVKYKGTSGVESNWHIHLVRTSGLF